jgi:hypothetical protein
MQMILTPEQQLQRTLESAAVLIGRMGARIDPAANMTPLTGGLEVIAHGFRDGTIKLVDPERVMLDATEYLR